jgi:hypothetical protein
MIGDTQVITVRGYELGLLDSYYIYYQAMCFVLLSYKLSRTCLFALDTSRKHVQWHTYIKCIRYVCVVFSYNK